MPYDFNIDPLEDIHLKKKIRPERDLLFILLLVLSFIVESYAFIFLAYAWFLPAAMVHALSFIVMLTYAEIKKIRRRDIRFAWLVVIFMPVMGPFAPSGILLSLFIHVISKNKALSFREWFESIFPRDDKSLAQTVYDHIVFGRDPAPAHYSVTYLMDVIRLGSVAQKIEAIFKISRHFNASFAPILKLAVEDSHNMIRVQAATAIIKIRNEFFAQMLKLERLKKEWPNNPGIIFACARHYDNYAFSGLLDDAQETENRAAALHYYRQYVSGLHNDVVLMTQARQAIGRLLLRMGKLHDARVYFEEMKKEGFFTPDMAVWYSECLFYLREYAVLRTVAQQTEKEGAISDIVKFPENVRGAIQLWAASQVKIPV